MSETNKRSFIFLMKATCVWLEATFTVWPWREKISVQSAAAIVCMRVEKHLWMHRTSQNPTLCVSLDFSHQQRRALLVHIVAISHLFGAWLIACRYCVHAHAPRVPHGLMSMCERVQRVSFPPLPPMRMEQKKAHESRLIEKGNMKKGLSSTLSTIDRGLKRYCNR